MWLLVDIATPSLERVYVYGTLEFEDTMDHLFNVTIIYIQVSIVFYIDIINIYYIYLSSNLTITF